MSRNLFLSSLLLLLVTAGTAGVWKIVNGTDAGVSASLVNNTEVERAPHNSPNLRQQQPTPAQDNGEPAALATLQEINQLLLANQYHAAVEKLDEQYSILSTEQVDSSKKLFLQRAGQLVDSDNGSEAEKLLSLFTASNSDLDAFNYLGKIAFDLQHWQTAFDALLNASAIEYRAGPLEDNLDALFRTASYLRQEKEKRNDWFGVNTLFQKLHDQHPSHPRFQLELAKAKLRIEQNDDALQLLEPLRYDPNFGAVAEQLIANLQTDQTPTIAKTPEPVKRGEILVPLSRRGNSFFAKLSINGRPTNMLLDTGASITALSKSTIARLGLQGTGRYIRLNTANGVRESQLYLANNLRIGKLKINELMIAEIDMESSSAIQGLLGTDLLNRVDPRYNYVIDNQRSALIFKRR